MCKYVNRISEQNCFYPKFYKKNNKNLPIDKNGFCLFHSNIDNWKIKNNFEIDFFDLINLFNLNYENYENTIWKYNFSGFSFPSNTNIKFDSTNIINQIDLSNTTFKSELSFKNINFYTLDLQNSKFKKSVIFDTCSFEQNIYANNSIFHNGLRFKESTLPQYITFEKTKFKNEEKKSHCEFSIKNCSPIKNIAFDKSNFNCRFVIDKTQINGELTFHKTTIQHEFIIKDVQVNNNLSFKDTNFSLKENLNPMYSSVSFQDIILGKNSKIEFKGKTPQEDLIKGELQINFKLEPKQGLIFFENFDLNKIWSEDKEYLFLLEKKGIVKIGKGCRKYYVQTELITIKTNKTYQELITDLTGVFASYFKIAESSNLGIEIVEKTTKHIKYYYFTDELISLDEFLKRIKRTEANFWNTLSNLTEIGRESLNTDNIELIDFLITLEGWWKKLSLRVAKNKLNVSDLKNLTNTISLDSRNNENIILSYNQISKLFNKALVNNAPIINNFSPINMNIEIKKIEGNVKIIETINNHKKDSNLSSDEKNKLENLIKEIKNTSKEKKESKFKEFIKQWLPTASETIIRSLKVYFNIE